MTALAGVCGTVVGMPYQLCCDDLASHLAFTCPDHPDLWDCVDATFIRPANAAVGIRIRDGGRSYIALSYCPFCGTALS